MVESQLILTEIFFFSFAGNLPSILSSYLYFLFVNIYKM